MNILHGGEHFSNLIRKLAGNFVFADADGLAHIPKSVFRDQVVFALAQKQTNGGPIRFLLENPIHSREIEIDLPGIFRFELAGFQLDHNVTAQIQIVKQQVNIKIITADVDEPLPVKRTVK